MSNKKGKSIDTTHLSIETAMSRGFLHRDYIAHCFRWSYVVKWLLQSKRYDTANIIDVGCGVDVPLARAMYTGRMTNRNALYVGVDVNKLEVPPMFVGKAFNIEVHGETDVCNYNHPLDLKFDLATSFEVLEHVEPEHMVRIIQKVKSLLMDDGSFIVSTPCYDHSVGAADNHVNEITYTMLGSIFEYLGFNTDKRFGTFASQKDYKHRLFADGHSEIFEKLSSYYDSNVMATIFAPMYPHLSRNCIWHLTKGSSTNFPKLEDYIKDEYQFGSSSLAEWNRAFNLLGFASK